MKWLGLLVLVILALLAWRVLHPTARLRVGDVAPSFDLLDQQRIPRKLSDYAGRWVVLFFYPRDDTPGCTREACAFRDGHDQFARLNAVVLGISVDSADSHARFAGKYRLPFTLLADPHGAAAAQFGALIRLGRWKSARRISFIITPDGRIARVFPRVNPAQHADEVVQTLKQVQNPLKTGG